MPRQAQPRRRPRPRHGPRNGPRGRGDMHRGPAGRVHAGRVARRARAAGGGLLMAAKRDCDMLAKAKAHYRKAIRARRPAKPTLRSPTSSRHTLTLKAATVADKPEAR